MDTLRRCLLLLALVAAPAHADITGLAFTPNKSWLYRVAYGVNLPQLPPHPLTVEE